MRTSFTPPACFLLAAILLHITPSSHGAEPPVKRPNFLVILTDDQSWTGTSLQMDPARPDTKSDYFKTPHIDALMTAGMRFTSGYASGAWCTPTRRSIQSGRAPSQHIYNRAADGREASFAKELSIPRALKQADPSYACAHFGKWHLQYESVPPAALGYDVSDGDTTNAEGDQGGNGTPPGRTPKNASNVREDPKLIFALTQRTGDFIETQQKAGRPWFVQLSHYAVHLRIASRQETLDGLSGRPLGRKHAVPEFAAMTEDLDAGIGLLMERLKSLKVLDSIYIIFLSDNGGRGKLPVAGRKDEATQPMNYPLAESKHSIYEGGLRVPFAMAGPGITPGSVSAVPVSGVDILPTLADLAGHRGSLGEGLDGGSLKDVALGNTAVVVRAHDFLVFESEGRELPRRTDQAKRSDYKAALRQGDYKLVKFYGGAGDGQKELYDLAKDLGEEQNVAASMPGEAQRMEKLLDDYLAAVGGLTKHEGTGKTKRKKISTE